MADKKSDIDIVMEAVEEVLGQEFRVLFASHIERLSFVEKAAALIRTTNRHDAKAALIRWVL